MRLVIVLALAACASHGGAAADAPAPVGHALGMNDVSILLPLPADPAAPVLVGIAGDGGEPLVDPALFAQLVTAPGDIAPKTGPQITYDQVQVVAVRFDLCDRSTVGRCPEGADGRLRLVLQPITTLAGATAAQDIALHAQYDIPAADLPQVVSSLRALAAEQDAPAGAPLEVSPAAAGYLAELRALVLRYARASNLAQLTAIGQVAGAGAFEWVMRGLDRGATFTPTPIPQIDAAAQTALVAGGDVVYDISPIADAPPGFALAVDGVNFDAAAPAAQLGALDASIDIQNPLHHDTPDTQCAGCHVSEYTLARRAAELGVDPVMRPGWFSTPRNTHVQSVGDQDPRVVRMFGWVASQPVISQRVANATAEVLDEIDARFPP